MKVYLGIITQNEYKNINELTKNCFNYFDGIIAVDGGSTDGTKELLESRKGCGTIIHRKWTNDFDFQNNEILRQGTAKIGDWIFLRDSMERFNDDFVKNIKEFVNFCKQNDIRYTHCNGKGFGFEYYDDIFFFGNPHWGIQNIRGKFLNMFDLYKKERDFAYRLLDGEEGGRPIHNFIDHFTKYYYVYSRSNHLLLGRENNPKEYQELESNRQKFRIYCYSLGLEYTLESLKNFLAQEKWKNDQYFISLFEKEEILKTFYRWHILKHTLDEIKQNQKTWSLTELGIKI
jgi:hypothetical protein